MYRSGIPATEAPTALRGLLITADRGLVRSLQRELRRCADCAVSVDTWPSLEEALRRTQDVYHWVAVDLDGAIAPSEGVRLARRSWPSACVTILSCWWSERDGIARDLADVVIHKPLRSPEVGALLRTLSAARRRKTLRAEPQDEVLAAIG